MDQEFVNKQEREISNQLAEKYEEIYYRLPVYLTIREYAKNKILSLLSFGRNYLPNDSMFQLRILDVGCGTGFFLNELENCGFRNLYGLDISEGMIKVAKTKTQNVKYCVSDMCRTCFPDNYFDIVIGIATLHHILNLELVFNEIFRILKRGGLFFFIEPCGDWIFENVSIKQAILTLVFFPLRKCVEIKNSKIRKSVSNKCEFNSEDYSPAHRHLKKKEIIKSIDTLKYDYNCYTQFTLLSLWAGIIYQNKIDMFLLKVLRKLETLILDKFDRGSAIIIEGTKRL